MEIAAFTGAEYWEWVVNSPTVNIIHKPYNPSGVQEFELIGLTERQALNRVDIYGDGPREYLVKANSGMVVTGGMVNDLSQAGVLGNSDFGFMPGTLIEQISRAGGETEVLGAHVIIPPSRLATWLFYNYDELDKAYAQKIADNNGGNPINHANGSETLGDLFGRLVVQELFNNENGIGFINTDVDVEDPFVNKKMRNMSLQLEQMLWFATCIDTLNYYEFGGERKANDLTRMSGYIRDRVSSVTREFNKTLASMGMVINTQKAELINAHPTITQISRTVGSEAGAEQEERDVFDFRPADVAEFCPELLHYMVNKNLISDSQIVQGAVISIQRTDIMEMLGRDPDVISGFNRLLNAKIAGNISFVTMYLDASSGFTDPRVLTTKKIKMLEVATLIDQITKGITVDVDSEVMVKLGSRTAFNMLQSEILRVLTVLNSFDAGGRLTEHEHRFMRSQREVESDGGASDGPAVTPEVLNREERLPIILALLADIGKNMQNLAAAA